MWSPHKHKPKVKYKKEYEHTTYPTHIKLTVKNKDHAYTEQLIPHGQFVATLPFGNFHCSITLTTLHACAYSMMDGGGTNFGAAP